MKTKQAIQCINDKYEGWIGYARDQREFKKLERENNQVVSLVEKLDSENIAYKKLLRELHNKYGNYWQAFDVREPNQDNIYIDSLLYKLEKKYLNL